MLDSNLPPFRGNINFNAQHAPMGAYWNFTCGHFGTRGGFALQSADPGNQDIFIGVKRGPRDSTAPLVCLPFFDPADKQTERLKTYAGDQIKRRYGWATDRWTTPDIDFTIYSPFGGIVDPTETHPSMSRVCLMPAVLASFTIDNSGGTEPKTGVFALKFHEPGLWLLNEQHGWRGKQRIGFGYRRECGFQVMIENEPGDRGATMQPFLRCNILEGIEDAVVPIHHLDDCGGVWFEVPPGARRTLLIALGAYQDGVISTRLEGKFYYTRHFSDLLDVLDQALRGYDAIRAGSAELDRELLDTKLSPDQQFLIAHSTRSYYANTQLLDVAGEPFWIVNDGETGLMNTLDVAVDHVFWELKQNPWVVRNLLDNYLRHYSYHDQLKLPQNDGSLELVSGGLSFCHDMGVHNNFAPCGQSSFEMSGRKDGEGFAYTTTEQLCNWILIAASYVARSGDVKWLQARRETIDACMKSLLRREGADESIFKSIRSEQMIAAGVSQDEGSQPSASSGDSGVWKHGNGSSNGHRFFDSARTGDDGAEVTTYDSLDPSLGRARNSVYLCVKRVAAYLGLEFLFSRLGDSSAEEAAAHAAHQAADAVARCLNAEDGFLPAVFDPNDSAFAARVLPAVEAMFFPWYWGTCDYGSEYKSSRAWLGNGNESFVAKLKRHTHTLLTDAMRRNVLDDDGLKLTSASDTTWLSKVAIVEHIAREVFNLCEDPKVREVLRRADAAHVRYQTDAAALWGCSDRFNSGSVQGSRACPRCITTTLWLDSVRA